MSSKTNIYRGYSAAQQRHFDLEPSPGRERNRFKILDRNYMTFNAGDLVPFLHFQILPGDNLYFRPRHLVRLSNALVSPLMDEIIVSYYFFKSYNRFVFDDFKAFMGEYVQRDPDYDESGNNTGGESLTDLPYNQPGQYELPTLKIPGSTSSGPAFQIQSLYDYFGLPYDVGNSGYEIQTLKLRHYNLIYNLYFRDENLQQLAPVPTSMGPDKLSQYKVLKVIKYHDYLTGALPFLQKGPSVSIGLIGDVPINWATGDVVGTQAQFAVVQSTGLPGVPITQLRNSTTGGTLPIGTVQNLVANFSLAQQIALAQIRLGFQLQRFYEGQARSGSRYFEFVKFMFDVYIPDTELQQPEFIGGGKFYININPVTQTSQTQGEASPLGTLAAFGVAYHREPNTIHCFSKEHGYVLGLMCVRTNNSYQQGLSRDWSYRDRFDFYTPTLAHLAEQEVKNKELCCTGIPDYDDGTFGYIGRYDEYRTQQTRICGYFRSNAKNPAGQLGSLDTYHLGQFWDVSNPGSAPAFSGLPHLNANFLIQSKTEIDRAMNIPSSAVNNIPQFLAISVTEIDGTRVVSKNGIPGFADHF
ncbi:major capsid protein [Sigmofec virus UA08Rod_6143]|uniref:Major capsid protein n=1 Tax=Sigmofec virus UA08Rod_6143 TaxID=2929223 RepID=A0A976R8H2_9VIRU|nr:major capsid protein [Sigmofec virus UA08Rod_6143]